MNSANAVVLVSNTSPTYQELISSLDCFMAFAMQDSSLAACQPKPIYQNMTSDEWAYMEMQKTRVH